MKKKITVLLLFLLCLNTFGLVTVFKLLQFHAKKVAEHIIAHDSPEAFVVFKDLQNNSKVIWEDEGKEFSCNGQMYDIAKEETKKGIHYYYCYDDKKESAITQRIDALACARLGNDKDPSGNAALRLLLQLAQVFIAAGPVTFSPHPIRSRTSISNSFHAATYSVCIIEILLPPPRA